MPRICFFSGDISRNGGTERVSTMIANALSKKSGFEILFLSLVEQHEKIFFPLDPSISHFTLGNRWLNPGPGYLKIIPKLRRFLKGKKIDILIDIDIVLDVLSIPATKGLPIKVIAWEHFHYDYEISIGYRKMILHHFTRRADAVVTLTKQDSLSFQSALHRTRRIQAIYNPMETPSAEETSRDSGPLTKENALITVGRLVPVKGMDYLAEVARLVLPAHPDWKWYVIGDGEERKYLEKAIIRFHLQGKLILTGRLDNVIPYLRKSRIYVMTSRSEGLPMCLLEAKAYKLPIVSFDIQTGPNEIVEHGKNGYLIPPFDCADMVEKIEKLMTEESLWKNFSMHSQDNIDKFHMGKIIQDWIDLFHTLLF